MANKKHVEVIKEGSERWNRWKDANPDEKPDLGGAILQGISLSDANLVGADLTKTDFRGADLTRAHFNGADFQYADFSDANLSLARLVDAKLIEVDFVRANLSFARLINADLSASDLRHAILTEANLANANLTDASLDGAELRGADFTDTDLSGASLRGANLREADLTRASLRQTTLRDADLTKACLYDAILSHSDLNGADVSFAYVGGTTFSEIDLSVVKGLETLDHHGPSTIGIDTLFRSDGKIPELFLREAGVPDDFITFAPSLVGRAIEFYSCFISYSHEDDEFSRRLHSRMRSVNLRVWFAPEDMRAGRKLHEEIFRAIQIHDKLLLVLSANSMKSEWVMTEIRRAKKVEREENRRKLFPIRLVDFPTIQKWECFDADSGQDLAVEVRQYYIPDFSNWKDHDSFETEFEKLLRDLRATES